MDLPDGLTEPNDGAYLKTETRTGPPLEYVAEKLRACLETLHSLHQAVAAGNPNPTPEVSSGGPGRAAILFAGQAAFRDALVSYLALNNLLALANDPDLTELLLRLDGDAFNVWIARIASEGSVT
ncbi:MAG: hypothetical protein ACYDC1_17695 [Limisphaerales bacterium]